MISCNLIEKTNDDINKILVGTSMDPNKILDDKSLDPEGKEILKNNFNSILMICDDICSKNK